MIKDRNSKDLTEAEGIKKTWQEYTEELYEKDLNDPDNYDDVVIHQELDILECEVKWALGSITMNKASGGDRNPGELLKILKNMMLSKCCTQYVSKFAKLSSGHKTGKGVFTPIPKKSNAKECSTTAQLCSFHMRSRYWPKSFKLGFSRMQTENFQTYSWI